MISCFARGGRKDINNNSELLHEYNNTALQKRGKYDNYGNLVISWELSRLTIRVARDPENKRREGEVVCALEGVRTRKLGPFLPPSKNCAILGL